IVLYAQFALGQRRRVDPTATGVADHPTIDLPQLETAFGAAAARLRSGGTMLVPLGGHALGGARLVLALAPRYPPPRGAGRGGLAALPVAALTSPALVASTLRVIERTDFTEPAAPATVESHDPNGFSWLGRDVLTELLRESMHEEAAGIDDAGGYLFVHGS